MESRRFREFKNIFSLVAGLLRALNMFIYIFLYIEIYVCNTTECEEVYMTG